MIMYEEEVVIQKKRILNLDIQSIELKNLLPIMKKGVVFTPNVDHLMKLQKDRGFNEAYKSCDWVICDSRIVNMAASFLGNPFKEVIPGSSLLPAFYNYHKSNKNIRIFLLGAGPDVALKAQKRINNTVGWKMVVDTYSPPLGFENDERECSLINSLINSSTANVLIVGLGAPKQEKWIVKNKSYLKKIDLFLALGASIDFEAGNLQRAPLYMQKLNLEWLYRLSQEPKRLWKRYLIDDLPFFIMLIKQKLNIYKNPFE